MRRAGVAALAAGEAIARRRAPEPSPERPGIVSAAHQGPHASPSQSPRRCAAGRGGGVLPGGHRCTMRTGPSPRRSRHGEPRTPAMKVTVSHTVTAGASRAWPSSARSRLPSRAGVMSRRGPAAQPRGGSWRVARVPPRNVSLLRVPGIMQRAIGGDVCARPGRCRRGLCFALASVSPRSLYVTDPFEATVEATRAAPAQSRRWAARVGARRPQPLPLVSQHVRRRDRRRGCDVPRRRDATRREGNVCSLSLRRGRGSP